MAGRVINLLLSHGDHIAWAEFIGGKRLRDDDE
jgi:hypothetical protein